MGHALLLIDDDESFREVMRFHLSEEGYEIDVASDGREGLRLFQEKLHPVVVTDLKMPKMDGLTVLKEISKRSPAAAVIVITAFGDIDTAVRAMKAGKNVITEKPMGVRSKDCHELIEMASDRGLVYQVGYMKRHEHGVLMARRMIEELLQSGRLGAITMARAWCFAGEWKFGVEDPIMTDEAAPEGVSEARPFPDWIPEDLHGLYNRVLNVDSHGTNLVRFLLGEDYEFEQAAFRDMSRPIVLQGWSESGANCVFELGNLPAPRWHEGVELFFEGGTLLVEPPSPLRRQSAARVVLREMGEDPRTIEPEAAPGWAFAAQARHFLASVRGEEPPTSPASDAVRDVELAEQTVRLVVEHG